MSLSLSIRDSGTHPASPLHCVCHSIVTVKIEREKAKDESIDEWHLSDVIWCCFGGSSKGGAKRFACIKDA
ncbi:hypothetical protein Scep_030381 [Stephania cephalantha]|uniref:Uncharacterized protein n=1 Tax=Stephania cephalantha TaxID=152367 RepID=A0AAP0HIK7_9MAGN